MTRRRTPRRGVPVVIACYRTSLVRRAAWFVADLWAWLCSPRWSR